MSSANRFAFLLEKPRPSLNREFYVESRRCAELYDEMWTNLLELIPSGAETYERRTQRMLRTLSPELRAYFLIRSFDGEWGSEGMEGTVLADDWEEWLPDTVEAFRALGDNRRADLIERVARLAALAAAASSDEERDSFHPQFKQFDEEWSELSVSEDLFDAIYRNIKSDVRPYLHPPEP
jgi:hypothetical protein